MISPCIYQKKNVNLDLFADDGSLHSSHKQLTSLEISLQTSLNDINDWCNNNRMAIHPKKSKSMIITTRQKHQLAALKLNLEIGNNIIEQVSEHKVLGIVIDSEMKWQSHINIICKRVSQNLYLLARLKFFVSEDSRKLFFYAHCLSSINYASTVWSSACASHIKKLNSLHRRGIKLIMPGQLFTTEEKVSKLNILPLSQQFQNNTALLIFKIKLNLAPSYLNIFLHIASDRYASHKYILPKTRIDLFKSSFSFQGPSIWNSLPLNIKESASFPAFKIALKKYFQSQNT